MVRALLGMRQGSVLAVVAACAAKGQLLQNEGRGWPEGSRAVDEKAAVAGSSGGRWPECNDGARAAGDAGNGGAAVKKEAAVVARLGAASPTIAEEGSAASSAGGGEGGVGGVTVGNKGNRGLEAAAAVEVTGACGSRGTGGCFVSIAPQKQQRRQIARPKLQPREGSDGRAARAASPMVEAKMGGPLAGKRGPRPFSLERDAGSEEAKSLARAAVVAAGWAEATAVVVYAFEAGLRLPLHPVISSCVSWWRVSLSQIAPNSWRYLVAFLGECHYAGITPTRSLFLSCFHLSKGSGGYYLSTRPGFQGWSFGLRWAARVIDNTTPALNDKERKDLRRLKEILPSSQVIQKMTEVWLVEVGLSPTPRGMLAVGSVWALKVVFLAKAGIKRKSDTSTAQPEEGTTKHVRRNRRRDLVPSEAGPSREAAGKAPQEPSIRDLCCLPTRAPGETYQAQAVGGLPEGQPSDPLVARWEGLICGNRVWADGEAAAMFTQGRLHPDMARELYVLPSDVLLSKSAKSLLWGHHYAAALMDWAHDAGRALSVLIDRNVELRRKIEEAAEQHASDLEAEGTRLKSEAKVTEEKNKDLQAFLRTTQTEVRLANKERPEKDKKLIEDYKESSGFQLGLVRSGQVTYEYRYRIALAHFKARHPGLEVEENPFGSCPEDSSVDMPDDVPFDDSLEAPKE
ncbi:hypothetical protein C4D60_Mb03t14740 [Musa balbisiana]|uniref:Transposase (putative) gypsy type domain-containing protein n=1 Tax=Musa balbisiana TaxID=52838 RepID=A0A4S8JA11_MUSBA|nr:hypothetical protein C4D60_Mb03t14740 [Musa balbisiana]